MEAPLRICPAARLTRSALGLLGRLTRNAATQSAFAWQRIPRARGARARRPALPNFRENVSLESPPTVRRAPKWSGRSVAILRRETRERDDRPCHARRAANVLQSPGRLAYRAATGKVH